MAVRLLLFLYNRNIGKAAFFKCSNPALIRFPISKESINDRNILSTFSSDFVSHGLALHRLDKGSDRVFPDIGNPAVSRAVQNLPFYILQSHLFFDCTKVLLQHLL